MDEKNQKQQLLIKFICVIAALSLWLYIYNIENPIKDVNITVPVEITNMSSLSDVNLALVSDKPLTVTLSVRGSVEDISDIKASDFSLVADMSGYAVKKGKSKIPVEVKKSPGSVSIVNSDNLWVQVTIDTSAQKSFDIQFEPQGKEKEGYNASHVVSNITKAVITGPKAYTDLVQSVLAKYSVDNISSNLKTKIKLEALDANGNNVDKVNINPPSIDVTIPVKKTKSVDVIINTIGSIPNGGISSVLPTSSKVDIEGESSVIDNINSIETENIDLSKLNGKDLADVKLIVPKGVALVNSTGTVRVKITYGQSSSTKIIQKTMTLPVSFIGLSPLYNANTNPAQVNVVVSGYESDINALQASAITCSVDMTGNTDGNYSKTVNLGLPAKISKVSQDATTVNVTVTKKN